jgi:NADPH:quinone reductase-like Zn-dependent oxidoreductase
MSDNLPKHGLQLQSTLESDGTLTVRLAEAEVPQPGPGEALIRVEAAPINPSDLMTMLSAVDPSHGQASGSANEPRLTFRLSPEAAAARSGRFGHSLPIGLEGAGTVIAAGKGAEHLFGRRVAALSLTLGMFAQYKVVNVAECVALPKDVSAREGAGLFCNPMTALAIAETVRLEGQGALIHTAAASNLGQMLVKICAEDGIQLVNVVRRKEQADLLRGLGAVHIVNSSEPGFEAALLAAAQETGAMIAFDAIGGGPMPGLLLKAMEGAARSRAGGYSPYGSMELKRVFIYGHLDPSPTVLHNEHYGMLAGVQLWAMPSTLARVGPQRAGEMQQRVVGGITGTFASHFAEEISLRQALDPAIVREYAGMGTGQKYVINPTL